jgi:hypothetical protein
VRKYGRAAALDTARNVGLLRGARPCAGAAGYHIVMCDGQACEMKQNSKKQRQAAMISAWPQRAGEDALGGDRNGINDT